MGLSFLTYISLNKNGVRRIVKFTFRQKLETNKYHYMDIYWVSTIYTGVN